MPFGSRYSMRSGFLSGDYPMVRLLLLINVAVFLFQFLLTAVIGDQWIFDHLALSSRIWDGEVWQVVTYMFLHSTDGPWHILFNMLALWMFGRELEMVWGSNEFLKYYLICGVGGGLTFLFFSEGVVIGASAAVFGILMAYGMTFPDQIIMMSLLFPIKAKYMVIIYGVITFMSIARPGHDGVAHLAHLGGMVFGFAYLKWEWLRWRLPRLRRPSRMTIVRTVRPGPAEQPRKKEEDLREKVDAILDKINAVGYDQLTAEEKETLLEASQHLADHPKPHPRQ